MPPCDLKKLAQKYLKTSRSTLIKIISDPRTAFRTITWEIFMALLDLKLSMKKTLPLSYESEFKLIARTLPIHLCLCVETKSGKKFRLYISSKFGILNTVPKTRGAKF